ncbi:MAG: chromate transporter [Thermodesulfovibrionales bacterium]
MDSKTFMDGIALGQVTPGPIVITSTFVGYLTHGTAGAIVSTVAVFTPSFLMVTGLIPVMDSLKAFSYFRGVAQGILISFVALLLLVTVKFGLDMHWDMVRLPVAVGAFAELLKKVDILYVVLITVILSFFFF